MESFHISEVHVSIVLKCMSMGVHSGPNKASGLATFKGICKAALLHPQPSHSIAHFFCFGSHSLCWDDQCFLDFAAFGGVQNTVKSCS